MVLDCYYDNRFIGKGAHKIAKPITPTYANFLFLVSGEISSNGFTLRFLELMTKSSKAKNQNPNKTKIPKLPYVAYLCHLGPNNVRAICPPSN